MSPGEPPRRRDPEATRQAILKAAENIFVEKGFAATSLSEIAQQAGVTKSLIHHHFGTKEELWTEVRRQRLSQFAERQTHLVAEDKGDGSVIARSVATYFHFVKDNPQWVRLNAWMILEDPRLSEMVNPELVRNGIELLREEQEKGHLRDDLDPRHVMASFVSLCMYWFMAQESYRRAALVDSDDELADAAYLEDMLKIFLEGVKPRA